MSGISQRLRNARERANFSQIEVSRRIGVNNKTLSGYERALARPDYETLAKLASLYGVSVEYLLYGDKSPIDVSKESAEDKRQLDDILEQFRQQMKDRDLSDEDRKKVLDVMTEVFWSAKKSDK